MSLATALRARIPAVSSALTSWALPSVHNSAVAGRSLPQIRRKQSGVWLEVIKQVPSDDPNKQGQLTFEDPDLADARILRTMRAEVPLRRRPNFVRHEKQWMKRKRMKMENRYNRLQEGVDELKAFIKFKQDHKPDW